MKKGYYIHFQGRASIGISKKLDMQIEEFQKYFEIQELEVATVRRNLLQRILGLLPMMSIKRGYKEAFKELDNPDFIYVRRNVADREYVKFWREIKRKYPKCKIIIEIFTYPYDKDDFGKWNAWPFYLKEIIYRPKLKKYIDRFVTYSDDEMIFDVPTIRTTNGIIVDKVKLVSGEFPTRKITLIGVAYMQRQHGYERILEGMKEYYEEKVKMDKVYLYLVGDGPEKEKYKKLVKKYGLEKYVKFFSTTTGDALDYLYDQADIALASFGLYKVNYFGKLGAIKTRECLAKGMPLITGTPIDILEEDFKYIKNFPNDSSVINIKEVVDFYNSVCRTKESKRALAIDIRKYAKEHADMEILMKPIVEYIKE